MDSSTFCQCYGMQCSSRRSRFLFVNSKDIISKAATCLSDKLVVNNVIVNNYFINILTYEGQFGLFLRTSWSPILFKWEKFHKFSTHNKSFFFSLKIFLNFKRLGRGGGQFDPTLWFCGSVVFPKMCLLEKGWRLDFLRLLILS